MSEADMSCGVSIESLEHLAAIWDSHRETLRWTCPFVLPPWLNAWWSVFGKEVQPLIAVVRQGRAIVGIAPLMLRGTSATFLGDPEVCDYFDCIVARGKENLFFMSLFAGLLDQGVSTLDLGPVRPDSTLTSFFETSEPLHGMECRLRTAGILHELDLPGSWDEFLMVLSGKERHELRRKLRRLHQAGSVRFRCVDDMAQLPEAMETFLRLFTMNREDKAAFMTGPMASFFRALAFAFAEEGWLRLFLLDLDGQPVASVFCFDYQGTRYLYNNGYDEAYRELSVGLISKVLSLEAAIHKGLHTYSFLKGGESYKLRLGGKEIPLSGCQVDLYRSEGMDC